MQRRYAIVALAISKFCEGFFRMALCATEWMEGHGYARELQIMHSRPRFIRPGYREIAGAGFSLVVACEGLKSQARYSIANGMHKSVSFNNAANAKSDAERAEQAPTTSMGIAALSLSLSLSLSLLQINMKPSSAISHFPSRSVLLTGRLIAYA